MEFGFDGGKSADSSTTPNANVSGGDTTNLDTGKTANDVNGIAADDINSISDSGDTKPKGTGAIADTSKFDNGDGTANTDDKSKDVSTDKSKDTATTAELVEGSVIEVGDDKYTVDKTGNVLDKDGNIFKEAKDTKDWIASFDVVEDGDKDSLSINAIQNLVGIDVTDDNDQPIVFENTPTGVKAYIDAVRDASRDDHYEEALNTLYQKYPVIPDVINYYIANGNSLEGFGEVQDRSQITIDDANEAQHESIIRTSWSEQGKKGDVEGYIAYLKSSGTLLATAKEELTGLQEADAEYKNKLATDAAKAEEANIKKLEAYWEGVNKVIKDKKIAGYEIPDTIIINKDGKRISATPNDFYNYIYQVDGEGKSAYTKALAQETPESRRDDELLRAYLKFVGGNYSNLVDMAINKDKVNNLKLTHKTRNTGAIKINKPTSTTKAVTDFGY